MIPKKEKKSLKTELWTLVDLKQNITGVDSIGITHVCDDELNQLQFWNAVVAASPTNSGYLNLTKEELFNFIEILQESHALIICYQSKPLLQQAYLAGIRPTFNYFDPPKPILL